MLDLQAIRAAFPEVSDVQPLNIRSGQKDVLYGILNEADVALKLIKPSEQQSERLQRELEAVARLESSYIPQIISKGERVIGGYPVVFLLEEFVKGKTLRDVLADSPTVSADWLIPIVRQLLGACIDFEVAQVVHRDIKPENVIVDEDEKLWIIDFGIVRLLDAESLTATSATHGLFTPGYGAPEQVRNLKAQIDVRADLYSVGMIAYEALHGANPYLEGQHDILQVIRDIQTKDLRPLRGVEPELDEFILSLCARFPSRRPQTAEQALGWFEEVVGA